MFYCKFISQMNDSKRTLNTTFSLGARVVEINGLEQNTSYNFQTFLIKRNGTKQDIQSGFFQTMECTPNGKTKH